MQRPAITINLTVSDLRDAPLKPLRAQFGIGLEKTQRELQGQECIALEDTSPTKQQIISSRTLRRGIHSIEELKDLISMLCANACAKLRAQGSTAALLQLHLATDRFRKDIAQYAPTIAAQLSTTSNSLAVNRAANDLASQIYQPQRIYKRVGIVLSQISSNKPEQTDLFAQTNDGDARLMQTIDLLNERYGRGTVGISTQGTLAQGQLAPERKSPNYTTDIHCLPIAGAYSDLSLAK